MNINKLNILFYLDKSKLNKKDKSPIKVRATFLGIRKQFSTGLFINPSLWNSKQQHVNPPEPDADFINSQMSLIRTKLNQAFLFLQVKGTAFTVGDIYKQYKGETNTKEFAPFIFWMVSLLD